MFLYSCMASIVDYERQLNWRLRQVEIGKASTAYADYAIYKSNSKRKRHDPSTPDPYDARMSKRQFEGRIKAWKRSMHEFDSSNVFASSVDACRYTITLFIEPDEAAHFKRAGIGNYSSLIVSDKTASTYSADTDWITNHKFEGIPN